MGLVSLLSLFQPHSSLTYPLVTEPNREQLAKQKEFTESLFQYHKAKYRMGLKLRNNNLKSLLLFSEDFFFYSIRSNVMDVIFSHISL